jgi:polysaccharide deacetylase 2 family uncharacterized protein YibQ
LRPDQGQRLVRLAALLALVVVAALPLVDRILKNVGRQTPPVQTPIAAVPEAVPPHLAYQAAVDEAARASLRLSTPSLRSWRGEEAKSPLIIDRIRLAARLAVTKELRRQAAEKERLQREEAVTEAAPPEPEPTPPAASPPPSGAATGLPADKAPSVAKAVPPARATAPPSPDLALPVTKAPPVATVLPPAAPAPAMRSLSGGAAPVAPDPLAQTEGVPAPELPGERPSTQPALPRPEASLEAAVPPAKPEQAAPAERTGRSAAVAVIIDDVGPSVSAARRAVALPAPVTLSFLPYAQALPTLLEDAARRRHEIFLHLGMEPIGTADPGPNALLEGLDDAELRRRIAWALGRVSGAVGVNNHMGSRLTADSRAMRTVMEALKPTGLMFVDSKTSPDSVAGSVAGAYGIASAERDVFLDNVPTSAAIRRQLEEVERIARWRGSAIAIGHPYAETLAELDRWLRTAPARGIRVVPASRVIAMRWCSLPQGTGDDCVISVAQPR